MINIRSNPVGHGNHNNVHYVLRTDYFTFKLCAFPDMGKIFVMSSSTKINKDIIDKEYVRIAMHEELSKYDLTLVGCSTELFEYRFESTDELMKSDYYQQQL